MPDFDFEACLVLSLSEHSMNHAATRKNQAEERRTHILSSALEVFAEKGFSRTTVKDLACAAGTSEGLMYHYFTNKQQLLEAAVLQYSFLPQLRNILYGTENLPCHVILKTLGHGFLTLLQQRSQIIDIFIKEGSSNDRVYAIWVNLVREGVNVLSDYLQERIEKGELRPHSPEITARCLFSAMLMHFFTRDILIVNDISEDQFIDEVVDNLLNGITQREDTAYQVR